MRLLVLQDVTLTNLDHRFRQSPFAQLIASLFFFSLAIGALCWYWFGDLPLFVAIFSGGFLFLLSLIFFSTFRKALAPTNWIVAVGPDRVLIKFRSYLNTHFPSTDPQVILLDPSEIARAHITKQKITASGSRGRNETSFHTFLDIHLPSVDLTPLKERLKYERNIKAQKTGKHTGSKTRHYPISVVGADTIRIEWRSPQDIIVPGTKKALAVLERQGITIESPEKETIDLTEQGRNDLRKAEDKILYLAERGNFIAATKLARRTYDLNLTEAKQFVEDLLE